MSEKSEQDFTESVTLLHRYVDGYYTGEKAFYRPLATELRKLLCDTNRRKDTSLLPRVRPRLKLKRLLWTDPLTGECTDPNMPPVPKMDGCILLNQLDLSINSSGLCIAKLQFQKKTVLMDVPNWVAQPFVNIGGKYISMRELIKSVADTEGAHSDPKFDDTLLRARSLQIAGDASHLPHLIAIADYILSELSS